MTYRYLATNLVRTRGIPRQAAYPPHLRQRLHVQRTLRMRGESEIGALPLTGAFILAGVVIVALLAVL